jgi:hypothetical protein
MRTRTVTLFLLFSFLLATTAWSREDRLTNTGAAPAAEGKIITDNDRNGNTGVNIEVKHMATPQSLTPPKHKARRAFKHGDTEGERCAEVSARTTESIGNRGDACFSVTWLHVRLSTCEFLRGIPMIGTLAI